MLLYTDRLGQFSVPTPELSLYSGQGTTHRLTIRQNAESRCVWSTQPQMRHLCHLLVRRDQGSFGEGGEMGKYNLKRRLSGRSAMSSRQGEDVALMNWQEQ